MRVSANSGHNLCEWFFYNSLAEAVKRGKPRNVAFIHVPPGKSEADLKAGVEIWQSTRRPDPGTVTDKMDGRGQRAAVLEFQAMAKSPLVARLITKSFRRLLAPIWMVPSDAFEPPAPDWSSTVRLTLMNLKI